ncbi:hypothetical protein CANINC_003997 [Pichia inconspicua]|uniref:TECPR1-like DysF domain-containing protein n=1 Tax=Pichia inconspicua TaxID=52247 RepID=A0A4T0WYU0_9ASCO|nr:hypothetical protein CANINC_003997 [[Candida] inconspicua]
MHVKCASSDAAKKIVGVTVRPADLHKMNSKLAEDYFSMVKPSNGGTPFSGNLAPPGLYTSLSWAESPDLDGLTRTKSHTGAPLFKIPTSTKIQTDDTIYTYHKIHLTTPVPDNLKPETPSDVLKKLTGKCIECTNLSNPTCSHLNDNEKKDSSRVRLLKTPSGHRIVPVKSILAKKGNESANVDAHFSNSVSFDTVNLKFSDDINNYPLSAFSDSDSDDGSSYNFELREGRSRSRRSDPAARLASPRSPSRSMSPSNRLLPALERAGDIHNLFEIKYPTSPIITHDACTLTRKHKLFDDLYAGRLKHTWVGIDWACNELLEDGDSLIIIASIKNPGRSLSRLQGRNTDLSIEVNITENKIRNSPEYAQAATENILKYALSILNPNRIVKITVELAVGPTNDVLQDMFELYQPSLTIIGVKPGKAAPTKAWATKRLTDRIVVKSPIPTIIVSPVNMGLYEEKLFKVLDKRMNLLRKEHSSTVQEVDELLNELDNVGIYTADDQLRDIKKLSNDDEAILNEVESIKKIFSESSGPNLSEPLDTKSVSSESSSIFGDNDTDNEGNEDAQSDLSVSSENPPALFVPNNQTSSFKIKKFELSSQIKIYKETLKLESEPLNEDSFKRYLTVVSDAVGEYGVQLAEHAKEGEKESALVRTLTGAPEEIRKTKSMVSVITDDEERDFNEKLKKYRQQKKLEQQQKSYKGSISKIPKINIADSSDAINLSTSPTLSSSSNGSARSASSFKGNNGVDSTLQSNNASVATIDMESLGNKIWDTAQSFSAAMEHAHSESGISGIFSSEKTTSQPLNKRSKSDNTTLPDIKENVSTSKETMTSKYADKFMERLISMAIPTTTTSSKRELDRVTQRIEMQKSRPQLSMQLMSKNSILLLQRLSIPFETIDSIINFINWEYPSITIATMLFISLCLLKPINMLTTPLFYICFEIIIPAYMLRNPNIDESVEGWENELPRPVNEFSREFLLNLTDLQNHMLLYVHTWNFINSWCWKLFYFKDEILTWTVFVVLLLSGIFLQLFGTSLVLICFPYMKLLTVILAWVIIIALHPSNRERILEHFFSEELRLKTVSTLNYYEAKLIKELDLSSSQLELRQLEVFELQVFVEETRTLNGIPIQGTLLLDNILPPDGWKYVNNTDLTESNDTFGEDDSTTQTKDKYERKRHLIFDSEKNKMMKEKRKYAKRAKKLGKKQRLGNQDILIDRNSELHKSKMNIEKRRQSNDFSNVLLDPLVVDKQLIEQLDTGVKHDGWYIDLCPSKWITDNYLNDVLEVDEDTKWVYDLVIMGNGVNAYSAGLGVSQGKLKRNRGDVRRRRWVRYVVREIVKGVHSDTFSYKDDAAVESTEESDYNGSDSGNCSEECEEEVGEEGLNDEEELKGCDSEEGVKES